MIERLICSLAVLALLGLPSMTKAAAKHYAYCPKGSLPAPSAPGRLVCAKGGTIKHTYANTLNHRCGPGKRGRTKSSGPGGLDECVNQGGTSKKSYTNRIGGKCGPGGRGRIKSTGPGGHDECVKQSLRGGPPFRLPVVCKPVYKRCGIHPNPRKGHQVKRGGDKCNYVCPPDPGFRLPVPCKPTYKKCPLHPVPTTAHKVRRKKGDICTYQCLKNLKTVRPKVK